MPSGCRLNPVIGLLGLVLTAASLRVDAEQPIPSNGMAVVQSEELPDAPTPQVEEASLDLHAAQDSGVSPSTASSAQQASAVAPPSSSQQTPAAGTPQSSSSSQDSAQQSDTQQTQHQKAEEQLKEQEKQRVAGIMATFNTTRNPDAVPLSSGQKYRLFFRSAFDPWPFALNAVVAGVNQAADAEPEWGQGMQGYARRYGAGYSDYFIGNFFGNAVLTSLLHEDPRYFQKGSGSFMSRFLWAAASTVWCKRDRGGWGPNWANVGGNLIGAAISRSYYPASERTVTDTITDGLTVSAEGIVGAEVIEFWPDMVRHHRRKEAEKQARAAAKQNKQQE
jgi:hypothetical protein